MAHYLDELLSSLGWARGAAQSLGAPLLPSTLQPTPARISLAAQTESGLQSEGDRDKGREAGGVGVRESQGSEVRSEGAKGCSSSASSDGASWEAEYDHSLHISLAPPARPTERQRERLPLLDNAKAALIFLVVVYHSTVVYTSADRPEGPIPLWSGVLCVLKPVVMPSFCLISGYLSRADLTPRRAYELCQLVATYAIFQTLYHLNNMMAYRLAGFEFRALPLQIFQPQSQVVTWFLLALALWRLLLPAVSRLRAPIFSSFIFANAALYIDLGLNYQNLFSFLPFFLVGHALPSAIWHQIAHPAVRGFFALTFVGVTAVALLFSYTNRSFRGGPSFNTIFANVTSAYDCMNGYVPNATPDLCVSADALLLRLMFYAWSVPLIGGFFALLPRAPGPWSIPGHMSMFVYLLHPLVITNAFVMKQAFRHLTSMSGREVNVWSPATDGWAVTSLVLPLSLTVVVLLSTPPIRWLLWPLIQPPLAVLVRDEAFRPISASYSNLRAAGQRRRGMDPRAR